MKKHNLFLIFFYVLLSSSVFSQSQGNQEDKGTLLLMHPTISTISSINYLIESGIFPVKELKLKGVYFEDEAYDYSFSEQYIKEHNLAMTLQEVDLSLQSDKLFCKNSCSSVFVELFNESEGVIFFGGPDIPPSIYGEKTSTLTVITDPYRHYFEASFLFHLLGGSQNPGFVPLLEKNPNYMIVGICLGMQTMNVATGGTLIQDIPLEVYNKKYVEEILSLPSDKQHRNYETDIEDSLDLFHGNLHGIKAVADSWLVKEGLVKPEQFPVVVSSHHQAAEKIGKGMRVVATSMDGKIIESIDHEKYPNVFGFQFHPEVGDLYNYDNFFQIRSSSKAVSLRSLIDGENGYEFHRALWKNFAEVLKNNKGH
jgi:putative glutamine amidotransferase